MEKAERKLGISWIMGGKNLQCLFFSADARRKKSSRMANKIIPGDDEAIFFASTPAVEAHHFDRNTIGTHAHNSMDGRSRTQWLLLVLFSLVCSTHGHTLRTGASRFSFRLLLPFGIDQTQPSFCLSPSFLPPRRR